MRRQRKHWHELYFSNGNDVPEWSHRPDRYLDRAPIVLHLNEDSYRIADRSRHSQTTAAVMILIALAVLPLVLVLIGTHNHDLVAFTRATSGNLRDNVNAISKLL